MKDYGPENEETAVYNYIKTEGLEADYELLPQFRTLVLGELIDYLENCNQEDTFSIGLINPHSWRGDYCQLAFEPAKNVKVETMLRLARACLGVEFQGYKGDWFLMSDYTQVYVDTVGRSNGTLLSPMLLEAMHNYGR